MLKIKLARFGKRNQPHYRIVVTEAKSKRDGQYAANIGIYAPTETPKTLKVDVAAFDQWVLKGAQPTETVKSLVERFKSGNPFPEKPKTLSKKAQAKQAAEAQAAAEAQQAAEAAAATPAPEAAPEAAAETPAEGEASAPTQATTESN